MSFKGDKEWSEASKEQARGVGRARKKKGWGGGGGAGGGRGFHHFCCSHRAHPDSHGLTTVLKSESETLSGQDRKPEEEQMDVKGSSGSDKEELKTSGKNQDLVWSWIWLCVSVSADQHNCECLGQTWSGSSLWFWPCCGYTSLIYVCSGCV